MTDPLRPEHRCCASCWYWEPNGDNPNWCHAAMGYTDPAFRCDDWRDLRHRTDPMTGEPWPEMNKAPLKDIS